MPEGIGISKVQNLVTLFSLHNLVIFVTLRQQKNNKSSFISALQASVRPVITYFFFILFGTIKGLAVYVAVKEGDDVSQAILNSWDQETAILFSTVISFWFGGRAMRKIRESKNG